MVRHRVEMQAVMRIRLQGEARVVRRHLVKLMTSSVEK